MHTYNHSKFLATRTSKKRSLSPMEIEELKAKVYRRIYDYVLSRQEMRAKLAVAQAAQEPDQDLVHDIVKQLLDRRLGEIFKELVEERIEQLGGLYA